MWSVCRFGGQKCDWASHGKVILPDDERGKRSVVSFSRCSMACMRTLRVIDSDIRDRSSWRRFVHLESAARQFTLSAQTSQLTSIH